MRLLEVKNNLIKLAYAEEESPVLGRFLALITEQKSYVAQFINLKSDDSHHFAVARLIFTFTKDGVVDNYDGSIPDMKSEVVFLPTAELLDLLPIETPLKIGKLAQQQEILSLDTTVFENNFTVFADQATSIFTFVSNCARQLFQMREKVIIVDTENVFEDYPTFSLGRDFKLPLNSEMIDYLIENELEETDTETKAVIQDVLYEVQTYVKSLFPEFLPIDTLIEVIASQYRETKMPELALLKNKLIKYKRANIFANTEKEFTVLLEKLSNKECVIVNISEINGAFQKAVISYLHNKLKRIEKFIYLFVNLNDSNSNKKLLKQLINNNHVFTTISVNHNYEYVKELKSIAQNIVIFQPMSDGSEFGMYKVFLDKLNLHECVVVGRLTQKVPFIVDCSNLDLGLTIEDVLGDEIQFVPKEDLNVETTQNNSSNNNFSSRSAVVEPIPQSPVQSPVEPVTQTVQPQELASEVDSVQPQTPVQEQEQAQEHIQEQNPVQEEVLSQPVEEQNDIEADLSLDDESLEGENMELDDNMLSKVSVALEENEIEEEEETQEEFEAVSPDIESMIKSELEKQDETEVTQFEPTEEVQEEPVMEQPEESLPVAAKTPEESLTTQDEALEPLGTEDDLMSVDMDLSLGHDDMSMPDLGGLDGETSDDLFGGGNPFEMDTLQEEAQKDIITQNESVAQNNSIEIVSGANEDEVNADLDLSDLSDLAEVEDEPAMATQNSIPNILADNSEEVDAENDLSDLSLNELTEDDLDFIEETQDIPAVNDTSNGSEALEFVNDDELPVYPANILDEGEEIDSNVGFSKGDMVTHPKYGSGIIEKIIKYGNKTLCSIMFEEVGRRLLDPSISEFEKFSIER